MKRIVIICLRIAMQCFYAICKLFPTRRKVVMISRELNTDPLDFALLREEIERRDPQIRVVSLCKTIPHGIALIGYMWYMLRCMAHMATACACVVDTYCLPVSLLTHKKSLRIVQVWHALGAIKKFGYQSLGLAEGRDAKTAEWLRMHKGYTRVFSPSDATADFYAQAFGVPRDIIEVRGMPRIDWLLSDHSDIRERFYRDYPNMANKPILLYVPTFRKDKPTAHDQLIDQVDHDRYHLIVSAHPISTESVDPRFKVTGYTSAELLTVADAVITDYSAIAFEAALLKKKLYFFLYDIEEYIGNRGLNINPLDETPHLAATDIDGLIEIIGRDYHTAERDAFCAKYIETADTNNTARIVDYLLGE